MKELPEFQQRPYEQALNYAKQVFQDREDRDHTHFIDLIAYDDGHFRALFERDFFYIQPGADEPSKSQWNTLKKHMKRIDRKTFVFKDHGKTQTHDGRPCYYVDFGFFLD